MPPLGQRLFDEPARFDARRGVVLAAGAQALAGRRIAVVTDQQRLARHPVQRRGLVRRVLGIHGNAIHALGEQVFQNPRLFRRVAAGRKAKIHLHISEFFLGVAGAGAGDGPKVRRVVRDKPELQLLLLRAAT